MTLDEHETIIGAWAEAPSGPGWSNRLIWVCIYDPMTGRHRVDALQPREQSEEILLGFPMYLAASESLIGAVRRSAEGTARTCTRERRAGRGGR